jgi:hypothetical protein
MLFWLFLTLTLWEPTSLTSQTNVFLIEVMAMSVLKGQSAIIFGIAYFGRWSSFKNLFVLTA